MMIRLFGLMIALALTGCPDSDDANDGDSGAGAQGGAGGGVGGMGGEGGGGGLCAVFDCGPGGTCVELADGVSCECDPGFMLQGLTCVDRSTIDAPDDFTCPAPGGDGDPIVDALTRQAYAQVENDRTCRVYGRNIIVFRDTGVFVFREQDEDAGPGDGGTVLYGCWSVTDTAADRISIAYDYGAPNNRNCGQIGRLNDPPCAGVISYLGAEDALYLIESEERDGERHVYSAVPANLDCTFCGDDPGCCPNPSWVADRDGPLCE